MGEWIGGGGGGNGVGGGGELGSVRTRVTTNNWRVKVVTFFLFFFTFSLSFGNSHV